MPREEEIKQWNHPFVSFLLGEKENNYILRATKNLIGYKPHNVESMKNKVLW